MTFSHDGQLKNDKTILFRPYKVKRVCHIKFSNKKKKKGFSVCIYGDKLRFMFNQPQWSTNRYIKAMKIVKL